MSEQKKTQSKQAPEWLNAAVWIGIPGVFCGIVILVNIAVARQHWLGVTSTSWPSTSGVVTESRVEEFTAPMENRVDTSYEAIVRYDYQVDGREYSNQRITFGGWIREKRSEAVKKVREYPVGSDVRVTYDPDEPSRAVLEPGADGRGLLFLAGLLPFDLIVIGIGWFICFVIWTPKSFERIDETHGIEVDEAGPITRIRLFSLSPVFLGYLTALALSIVVFVAVLFFPSLTTIGVSIGGLAFLTLVVVAWAYARRWLGAHEFVIDHREQRLTLPGRVKGFGRIGCHFESVKRIEVRSKSKAEASQHTRRERVILIRDDGRGHEVEHVVLKHRDRKGPERLKRVLADALGLSTDETSELEQNRGI